jgi:hypothetical protein
MIKNTVTKNTTQHAFHSLPVPEIKRRIRTHSTHPRQRPPPLLPQPLPLHHRRHQQHRPPQPLPERQAPQPHRAVLLEERAGARVRAPLHRGVGRTPLRAVRVLDLDLVGDDDPDREDGEGDGGGHVVRERAVGAGVQLGDVHAEDALCE